MLTLAIAAVAAVVAAAVVSHFWRAGTIWATAMTPVLVALIKEALERPARKVREVTVVPRHRRPDEELLVEEVEPVAYPGAPPEPAGYKTYGVNRKRWKLAIATGLAAFALVALTLTVPELVAGRSIFHSGEGTTLGGGRSRAAKRKAKTETQTQTVTTTVPSQTQTTTTTPAQTSTTPTTTPTTPAQTTTTPAPQNTTTSPPPGQTTPTTVPTP